MTSSSNRRAIFLHEMGVGPVWRHRDAPEVTEAWTAEVIEYSAPATTGPVANISVIGDGDEKANWLFIGEGPGYNQDLRGEPSIGNAGRLLDNMLLAMGLKRGENAYVASIVKRGPTDAEGPGAEDVAACLPYLERLIEVIQPTIIVALGKTAALSLFKLDPETPVSSLRGKVHRYGELPLVVTYHPAYLLRNLADKKKAWADLSLAMSTYATSS
jgi:DNA polymerase